MTAPLIARDSPLARDSIGTFRFSAPQTFAKNKADASKSPASSPKRNGARGKIAASAPLLAIDVLVPGDGPRLWQKLLVEQLDAEGHDVAVIKRADGARWPSAVTRVLELEHLFFRRERTGPASIVEISETLKPRRPALIVDLAGAAEQSSVPTLRLLFEGGRSDLAAVMALVRGRLPTLAVTLDGRAVVGSARPMVDRRQSTALGSDDILARAATLMASAVRGFAEGRLVETSQDASEPGPVRTEAADPFRFVSAYVLSALPRLAREAFRRMRFRHAHWRVGYRFIDGAGVADIGALGVGWSVLPDDGARFYADPFAFAYGTRPYIFVEDYSHATHKGVISVIAFDADGLPQAPRPVLEAPHHLSYPQVFERDGAIWMLPEATKSGKLTLYRAVQFPDRWVAKSVLIEDREISDATLLEHDGRLWLFATERDGHGSTSDTMVVFHAAELAGPWTPHPMNPILIDRSRARAGGAFVRLGERIFLPVQDGTHGYGSGLGLSELLELTPTTVRLAPPRPISTAGDFPHPQIHTLNRSGRLEVIDGIAAMPRRVSPPARPSKA